MAVTLYDGFTNKITGETFRCISFDRYAFRFDWIVEPKGYMPFEHIHLKQDEIFYVKKGELRILSGKGSELQFRKGNGILLTITGLPVWNAW
jgi:hypothetical protein